MTTVEGREMSGRSRFQLRPYHQLAGALHRPAPDRIVLFLEVGIAHLPDFRGQAAEGFALLLKRLGPR